ncbi:MAG: carbohydrate ABC transporter permease, partial [Chloroflexia bacterium]|nr:carbohydrate ABC transporter permease [Chloroflexia bacterium]
LDYVPFARIYANTIIVTILRVIGQVFLASLAAFAFSRMQFPGRDFLFFLLLAGLMVPQQVLMIPNYAMMRQVGWLDTYQGLVVPLLFSSFGVFLLRQYFLSIPADFQEAATLEGANPFQIYWQIYLPLARPALAAFAFLVIQWSWNEFLWALIMTSRTEMQVLSVGVALFQGQYFTNNALLMAAANMATIPVLLLFLFFQRQLVEGITLSGLK